MTTEFTEDDIGKAVVTRDGEPVGAVADVRGTTAEIEPDPEIDDPIRTSLNWDDADEMHRLQRSRVDEVTDDELRLEERS